MSDSAARTPMRKKVYVDGRGGVRVPFSEVGLTGGEPPMKLYDTSGPGADANVGLQPLRDRWIRARDDVEDYAGRAPTRRDDGRAALRAEAVAASGRAAPTAARQAGPNRDADALCAAWRDHPGDAVRRDA